LVYPAPINNGNDETTGLNVVVLDVSATPFTNHRNDDEPDRTTTTCDHTPTGKGDDCNAS
jgi:hypothetical protein